MMQLLRLVSLFLAFLAVAAFTNPLTTTPKSSRAVVTPAPSRTVDPSFFLFKKPDEDEDLSYMEVRDMTREEMSQLNAENERVMNAELWGMTIFSLILSVPMLYLVWVGFFSETAEMNLDM